MVIVGAFVVPHGSMILDPEREEFDTTQLHAAMQKVAVQIQDLNPELIFLTSPHGIMLSEHFGLYHNTKATGSAEWDGKYKEFSVDVPVATERTMELYDFLQQQQQSVSLISCFSPSLGTAPLRWAEAVPLHFLNDKDIDASYIIMSQPLRRYQAATMLSELHQLGNVLYDYFHSLKERSVILISADLAHTHATSAQSPYKPTTVAEDFDTAIQHWVETQNFDYLKQATELSGEALACGLAGIILLHGILKQLNVDSTLLCRANPTYYGMLVASFL